MTGLKKVSCLIGSSGADPSPARSSLLIQQGVPCAAARDSTLLGEGLLWCLKVARIL
jgi:hypothetical protein